VEYYEKYIKCLDENGEKIILWGKKKEILGRMAKTMQEKRSKKKRVCVICSSYLV